MTLDQRLASLDRKRRALLDEMAALPGGDLVARPLANKWSILEIIEHLVIAERAVLRGLPEPADLRAERRRPQHYLAYILVMVVLRFGIPVKVPSARMVPRGKRSLSDLRELWDENHRWLKSYITASDRKNLRQAVFMHPVAGPLSVAQAVHMDQFHVDTHIRQIRKLQTLLGDAPREDA